MAMIADTSGQDRVLTKAAFRSRWRWLPGSALALGALVGAGYVVLSWLGAERSVDRARLRIARVERGALVRDVVADGRVVAASSPTLYAVAAGTIDLQVRPGDTVARGGRLATIASPELQSKLTQERATLAELEAGLGRARLDIEHGRANGQKLIAQAEIDRQTAAREVEINRQMFERGVIAELEWRRSEDLLKKAEITLRHSRVEAGLAGNELAFDVRTREQARDRQRAVVGELERQVAALDIVSPVDGQVGQLFVAQRAQVAANAPIMTVVDLGAFELEINVPDSFARDIGMKMPAEIRSGATSYAARVRSVSPEVVNGDVATRLEFVDKRPEGLRQNQRLAARILIEDRQDVLKIERGPFVERGGGNTAYFVDGKIAVRRPIRIGALSLDAVEIVSGARPGDEIVVGGSDGFQNAQQVRISD
jgi:HlyD family secretion protein